MASGGIFGLDVRSTILIELCVAPDESETLREMGEMRSAMTSAMASQVDC